MASPETLDYIGFVDEGDIPDFDEIEDEAAEFLRQATRVEETLAEVAIFSQTYDSVTPRYTPAPSKQRRPKRSEIDPIREYINRIDTIPLLRAEEEVELAMEIEAGLYAGTKLRELMEGLRGSELTEEQEQYQNDLQEIVHRGVAAKQSFIDANLRLVVSLSKFHGGILSQSDLISEGNLGLIRAVEKFDYMQGVKFSSYATWWIRDFMQKANRRKITEGSNSPIILGLEQVDHLYGEEMESITTDRDQLSIEEIGLKNILQEQVQGLMRSILGEDSREYYVVQELFMRGKTYDEVAAALGVNNEAVRWSRKKALAKLRRDPRMKQLKGWNADSED